MARFFPLSSLAFGFVLASAALAQNPGQAELDKATQLKITATTIRDLTEVIRLCESASKKGLDQNNTLFAKTLWASALVQRGSVYANKTMHDRPSEGNWRQDRKDALADLEKGVELNPKQPQALWLIARLNLLPEGNAKRAAAALDEVIAQSADEPPLRAEALVLRAGIQVDPAKKLADLDAAVQAAPRDVLALRSRGIIRMDMNNFEAAIDDFDKAIELDPKQTVAYQLKAFALVRQNKLDDAHVVLAKAIALDPRNVELLVLDVKIFRLQANYKPAIDDLDRALLVDPNNVAVLGLQAAVYQEMGDKKKALAAVDRILRINPRLPGAMRGRAMLLDGLGNFDDAAAELEKLRKSSPKDPLTLLQLGGLYTKQKKFEKAIEAFSALAAASPDEWIAYTGRAGALLALGRRAEAIADYNSGLRLRPTDVGILNNLAWILATAPEAELRNGKRAVVLAVEACKLTDYKQDFILSTLAAAYAEAGDFDNARKWSAKAVELGTKEHIDAIKKELDSYKTNKPWRELSPTADEKRDLNKPEAK